ncbi:MAG: M10 family metallopeptidase domain-containing protein [Planctomycetes bacterium]|nr:M10 family metallopeptidase domain-containing protein [Planctomycetota bacterium]
MRSLVPPIFSLALLAQLLVPAGDLVAFTTIGGSLSQGQRDFRVYNNFADPGANENDVEHPNFPGALGAEMSIWKACVEWSSRIFADGTGDPANGSALGSGGADFDPYWAGNADDIGGTNDNIMSAVGSCGSGVLAYCETPISNGWRIRFCEGQTWDDGPGYAIFGYCLQGVACHEYGHALGLGHSTSAVATMYPTVSGSGIGQRSIAQDDIDGVQFIYGTADSNKCEITGVEVVGDTITITGNNFSGNDNDIWFTRAAVTSAGSNPRLRVQNIPSSNGAITVTIPSEAGPGVVMVKRSGSGGDDLSNPWPTDLVEEGLCDPDYFCVSTPNSTGNGAFIAHNGTLSASAADLSFDCYGLPVNQYGVFYYGAAQTNTPFGNGVRCVGAGGVGTFRLPLQQSDSFGSVSYAVDFSAPPVSSGAGALTAGSTWYFQYWYRDPQAGGSNFNLSDALGGTFCP